MFVLASLLACVAGPAQAHDPRGSVIYVDVGARAVAIELLLPLTQLSLALGRTAAVDSSSSALELPSESEILEYVRDHLSARTRDGNALRLELDAPVLKTPAEGELYVIRGRLVAAHGAGTRWFELHYDAIAHHIPMHDVYVFMRRDIQAGMLGDSIELLGMMHGQKTRLVIDRTAGSVWQGLTKAFMLGTHHIAEGTDHLLFLFMLLLPTPLLAAGRRWGAVRGLKPSAWAIFKLVTAFTVGHSLTLIVSSVQGAMLPVQPVEVLIACSIAVSAVHVLRPVFAGREVIVAAGFGLVHGLAFATVLRGFGFDTASLALALLGFNLGIEAMQLAVLLLVMPWLVLASRSVHYRWLRIAGGCFGLVAACGWIAERALHLESGVPAIVELIAARAPWLIAVLALLAVSMNARSWLRVARARLAAARTAGGG